MTDSVFRTKVEPTEAVPEKPITQSPSPTLDLKVEPPYLDYERETGKPYVADYFKLGDLWQDKVGGFEPEINTIKSYVQDEIEQGRIDNSVEAVQALLKKIEKEIDTDKTERVTIKIAKMAAYTKFLYETREINQNRDKYSR